MNSAADRRLATASAKLGNTRLKVAGFVGLVSPEPTDLNCADSQIMSD